jgi:hypothetical protein
MLVGPSVRPLVGPHIISKTGYVAIASRRGEGRGNQLMSKTGYVEIASRLITVARSCYYKNNYRLMIAKIMVASAENKELFIKLFVGFSGDV